MTDERPIRAVLFACNMNSVRSPMAEALARHLTRDRIRVESCGVFEGALDPFAREVLEEIGVAPPTRPSRSFAGVDPTSFDLVIALTGEAAGEARRGGATPEFWETENPSEMRGDRDALMAAYREVRDQLKARIEARLAR